jgi:hypothetical protein
MNDRMGALPQSVQPGREGLTESDPTPPFMILEMV